MKRAMGIICLVLVIGFGAGADSNEPAKSAPLRLLLSEVQPGTMATQQYCMLVFADRHFHAETANRKMGRDRIRKVYEGQLSENDWNALGGILESKEFRDLKVAPSMESLVMEDSHPYTISVAREKHYQNMEFLNKKSLKPYESQVRPLLQWWKSMRSAHLPESNAPIDSRCSLDSAHAIFSH